MANFSHNTVRIKKPEFANRGGGARRVETDDGEQDAIRFNSATDGEAISGEITFGEPKATSFYTVEQLKKMGMVGVYTTGEVPKKELHLV